MILATVASLSSVSSFIILTPWVFLPITEIPLTGVRIITPFLLINISSSLSLTTFIVTTFPFFSVIFIFVTPEPPLEINL